MLTAEDSPNEASNSGSLTPPNAVPDEVIDPLLHLASQEQALSFNAFVPKTAEGGGRVSENDYAKYLESFTRRQPLRDACDHFQIRYPKRATLEKLRDALVRYWYYNSATKPSRDSAGLSGPSKTPQPRISASTLTAAESTLGLSHTPSLTSQPPRPSELDVDLEIDDDAKLNELDIIDAVLTTDSDTLIFGAQCVIRSLTQNERRKRSLHSEEMVIYSAESISHTTGVELTTGGLLLLALILEGDYSDGLQGIGPAVACGLAKSGFGDRLLKAFRSSSDEDFEAFRDKWLEDLRNELKSNLRGNLPSQKPALIRYIPDAFPPRSLLELYVNPLTSFSPLQKPPDFSTWKSAGPPDISQIASFCQSHLGWNDDIEMLRTFHNNLWEGIFLQTLYSVRANLQCQGLPSKAEQQDTCNFDVVAGVVEVSSLTIEVIESMKQRHQVQRVLRLDRWNRITFSTEALIAKTGVTLQKSTALEKTCKIWVPQSILPSPMKNFKNSRRKSSQRDDLESLQKQNRDTAPSEDSPEDDIIYLTTPPPRCHQQKERQRLKLCMSKDVPEVEEVIDLTTPPPENRSRLHGKRQRPDIVDLTKPTEPRSLPTGSSPSKRSRTDLPRQSRVLAALDSVLYGAD